MNEVEYILRIVLKARDELAGALRKAREELRLFANAADSNKAKIDGFNASIEKMNVNVSNITDKFKEWREVIQGTAGGNDKARKSFGDLGREVDTTNKATQRHTESQVRAARAQDALLKSADKLRNEYRKLQQQEQSSDKDREYTLFRLQAIGRELENLSKKVDDPAIRRFYFNWAQDSKRAADSIVADNKRVEEAHKQLVKQEEEASTKRQRIRDRDAAARAAFQRTLAVRERLGEKDHDFIDVAEARRTVAVLKQVANEYDDNTKTARRLRGEAERLSNSLRQIQRDGNTTKGVFSELRKAFSSNSDSLSTIDNQFRGLGLLAIIGFANQLITVLGGLAGSFTAVASSAVMAGGAIGGAFAAGIAQAMPSIGLLGAAMFRVKGVMDAVNQAQLLQVQNATKQATSGKRVADSTDAVKNAQDSLADAQRRVGETQEALTKARRDGRRELEDLIQAENDAKLAAIGAALSQKEAQQELVKAQATGDTEGIQRAQLQLLQAQADAQDALTKKKRAAADADRGRRGGVEGLEGVRQARRQAEDAARAVEKADRGVQKAKRGADAAVLGTETAAGKLQALLAQLSPAERRLYQAITNFQALFREGVYRNITDNIVNSFARAVEKVTKIIQMPDVIREARKTSRALAGQLNRVFDAFTTAPMIQQFLRIAEAGRKNLRPLATIIINLGKAFVNIAEAAGPSFRRMLRFISDLVGQFLDLTKQRRSLREFFNEGERHFEAWIKLGVAVIRLFAAIMGAGGASSGLRTVNDATKAVDGLTKKVDDNRKGVGKFFEDSRKILHQVVGVITVLAEELFKSFSPRHVSNFAALLKEQVIPALGNVIAILGNITDKVVAFGRTPIGGEIIKATVAFLILSRVVSGVLGTFKLLGTFIVPVAKVFFGMVRNSEAFWKFIQLVARILPQFARFVPFLGWAAAIALLLQQLGLLDDAWRALRSGFNAFWKEVAPALGRLTKAFGDLWDAVAKGRGLFSALGSVLRPVLKVVIELGGIFLRVFGRLLGRIVSGALDILTGFITFLTGIFTGDWRKAWSGIRLIFRGFFRAITATFRALPELIGDIAKKILPAFRRGIAALWDWLKDLPKRLGRIASEGAKAFVDAFKNVGKDIIKGILAGLKDLGGFARDIANSFIDLLNRLLPNKLSVPGAPDINLPNNPIPHLAQGGPVPGAGRGDTVAALLEPGEHVLTRQEVAALGGHGAVFALRRALGGGGQGGGGRFQRGGAATAGGLTVTFQGGSMDDFTSSWRRFWLTLLATTRNGSNQVEAQFRDMRVNTTRSVDRIYRDIRRSLADIQNSFEVRGRRIVNSWSDMWDSLKKVAYDGIFYIAHETNRALVGLGEKHVDFGLTAPEKGDKKASGGFVGGQGQRGQDRIHTVLGAGEAVLNWAHQRYIAPAVEAYYGHPFSDTFRRVRGYHAGGPEQPGFAGGRSGVAALFDGHPSNVVSGIIEIVRLLKKKFPGLTVTSTRDHGAVTSTGGLSDHPSGHAVDIASADYGLMNRAAAFIKSSGIARKLKQGIHNPNLAINQGQTVSGPGFFAGAWPQHLNHIHLAMAGALGRVADMITSIAKQTVTGPAGGLRTMVQAALDMVRKTANKFIDDKSAAGMDVGMPGGPGTPAPAGQHKRWIVAGLRLAGVPATTANIAAQYALDMGESGGNPKIIQQIHDINSTTGNLARGIAQVIPPTFNAYKVEGHGDIFNPIDNIAASARYQIAKYGHLVGHPGYARGGEIPGQPGAPVPILAHAREWVLNLAQQRHLAQLLRISREGLRSMLGFHGPSHTAQGGVEATEIDPLTAAEVKGIDSRSLRRIVMRLRKIGAAFVAVAAEIGSVEEWSGYIDRTAKRLGRLSRRIHARRRESTTKDTDFDRGIAAFADAVDGMLTDTTGMFAKLRTSIERRGARMARRLLRSQFRAGRGGVITRTDAGSDEAIQQAIAQRELDEQRRQRPELVAERQDIARTLRRVRRQQRRRGLDPTQRQRLQAQETQLQGMLDEARQRVTDNISAIYEAQQAFLQAQLATQQEITDSITKRYEAANTGLELFRRVATAVGNEDALSKLAAAQRNLLAGQANELERRIAATRRVGTREANEAADQLAAQVADLRVQIFESIQQELHDAMERINTRAQRRLGRLDLAGRLLDAVGAVGLGGAATLAGERFTRGGIFAQRGTALQAQRAGLQGVLRGAQAQGNLALIQDLTDQLAELDVTIKENTKAAFTARVEDINNRADFGIRVNDLNKQILELGGAISGQTDQVAIANLLQSNGNILAQKRIELEQALADARKAGDTQAVNDLTVALLENQVAILQNTQALDEVNGTIQDPQTFSSSAWQRFREAIFTGMGQVLPQYNVGNLMGAGVNTGAQIIPPASSMSSKVSGDTNINLYEAGRPPDLQEISSVVAFAAKTAQ